MKIKEVNKFTTITSIKYIMIYVTRVHSATYTPVSEIVVTFDLNFDYSSANTWNSRRS